MIHNVHHKTFTPTNNNCVDGLPFGMAVPSVNVVPLHNNCRTIKHNTNINFVTAIKDYDSTGRNFHIQLSRKSHPETNG